MYWRWERLQREERDVSEMREAWGGQVREVPNGWRLYIVKRRARR